MLTDRYENMRNRCDTIWEYDSETEKILICKDTLYPQMENHSYSAEEVQEFYRARLFEPDNEIWDAYLSHTALKNFPADKNARAEFEIRLLQPDSEPDWYRITVERQDEHKIIISDKNIYKDIKNMSLDKAVKNLFDSMIYVDIKHGNYIVIKSECRNLPPLKEAKYSDMIGKFFRMYADEDEAEELIKKMQVETAVEELKENEHYVVCARLYVGRKMSYKKMIFSYLDSQKKFLILTRMDVSDLVKGYEREINRYRAENYRDALTGTYNRKYMEQQLRNEKIAAGVAILDIDDFKLCNDIYGHNCGDAVLINVIGIINRNISEQDILIRYGGDEFILIMPGISEEDMEEKLKRIRKRIYSGIVPEYPSVQMSVSIGGVLTYGNTIKEAVFRADKLMYYAKNHKNTVVTEKIAAGDNDEAETLLDRYEIKPQILIVDDAEINREILAEILGSDFRILTAGNGEECIEMLQQYGRNIALILLDIVMPVMDGFEVLSYMNKNNLIENIPVIMISSASDKEYMRRAYGMGISDYISRPFDTQIVFRRVCNVINLYSRQRRLVSIIAKQTYESEKNNRMMLEIFSNIVELRNGEDSAHVLHVNVLTGMLLERLLQKTDKYNLSWKERSLIVTASALHDIGKMGISKSLLNKKGKLTPEEFETVKQHTVIGAKMLEDMAMYKDEALVKTAIEICRHHHERYDGNGYPDGLKGDDIPISAQVVALADVYDALVSERPYKETYTHDEAMRMILNGECGCFNPLLLECFTDISENIKEELQKCLENDETLKKESQSDF